MEVLIVAAMVFLIAVGAKWWKPVAAVEKRGRIDEGEGERILRALSRQIEDLAARRQALLRDVENLSHQAEVDRDQRLASLDAEIARKRAEALASVAEQAALRRLELLAQMEADAERQQREQMAALDGEMAELRQRRMAEGAAAEEDHRNRQAELDAEAAARRAQMLVRAEEDVDHLRLERMTALDGEIIDLRGQRMAELSEVDRVHTQRLAELESEAASRRSLMLAQVEADADALRLERLAALDAEILALHQSRLAETADVDKLHAVRQAEIESEAVELRSLKLAQVEADADAVR